MVADWIDRSRDELLRFATKLVRTPSPNPPGDERAVVEVIMEEMDRLGLSGAEIAAKEPHRPNVIFRLPGSGDGPTLMLAGHTDTKPVGERTDWTTDPMDPVVIDGNLHGLGATDMKGAVAAMVYAAAALHQSGADLTGDLLLVLVADEEFTMNAGSRYLATEYGLEADIALIGEPSGIGGEEFEFLHLLSRGVCCFKVRVRGTQMHSSLSDRLPSVNASVKLAEVLARMDRELELTCPPHPLCAAPTVNLGVLLRGGVNYGVLPGLAKFSADVRILPGMTRQQLERDVQAVLDRMRRDDPDLDVELEFEAPPLDWMPPTEVPGDHPFVGALLDACEAVLRRRPTLSAFPGGTDAMNFHGRGGIPTIPSLGPGWLPLAHGPDERVSVEGIVQAAKIYAISARTFLSTPKTGG